MSSLNSSSSSTVSSTEKIKGKSSFLERYLSHVLESKKCFVSAKKAGYGSLDAKLLEKDKENEFQPSAENK